MNACFKSEGAIATHTELNVTATSRIRLAKADGTTHDQNTYRLGLPVLRMKTHPECNFQA